jgi:hypothetical protein
MTQITERLPRGFLIAAVVASAASAGCDVFAPDSSEFTIQIDSVRAPGAVSGGAPFEVLFFGPVGPDGCHRFKAFRTNRSSTEMDVTVVGERVSGECVYAPVYLRGAPLTIAPPVSDPFTLRVHQPNGAVLTRIIRAE